MEFPSLPHLSHPRGLLQPQPQLQFQIDTETENLRWKNSSASDVTHQPSSTSPKRQQPTVVTTTTTADPVLDQFQQMRLMISTFLGARHDPIPSPRQSFCNYLHSEIEHLEEQDFLTFTNETVKLLSEIQYKAEECKGQVTIFQLPETTQAAAGCEYILSILETQSPFQLRSLHR